MKTAKAWLGVLVCVGGMCCVTHLHGQPIPASIVDTYTPNAYNADFSMGWRFTPTQPFKITHLGVFDVREDGVPDLDGAGGQQVRLYPWGGGMYLREGVVPTTTTIPAPDPEPSGTLNAYYVELDEPVIVDAGVEYFIAARVPPTDNCYNCTFLDEELRPFERSWGHATDVNYYEIPDEAIDNNVGRLNGDTFPIGPNGDPSNDVYHWYGPTFKYELVPLIPGDANFDEKVNEEDAGILADYWGEIGGWGQGNFDDDDVVGPRDAAIMAANWYYGMPAEGATSVPEPSIFVLALGMVAGLILTQRKR
ncbi:MAG: hypothetical protein JW888_03585 [Pirellulales bacterium]|nr:hypothetical protein [Pirellulales bacterium]